MLSLTPIVHGHRQWQIYMEAKEAVLGGPRLKGPPKFKKNGWGITITPCA